MLTYVVDECEDGGEDIVSLSRHASRIVEHAASTVPDSAVPAEHTAAHAKATAGARRRASPASSAEAD